MSLPARVFAPFGAFLLPCLTAPAGAQSIAPATDETPTRATPLDALAGLAQDGSALRAIGADYKARIDGDGMTLTPALGETAPVNMPLRWRAMSIRRGGATVWTSGTAGKTPRRVGELLGERKLDASITERFTVRPKGVEVSYAFDAPLPGGGDLVVRVAIETDLAPFPEPDAEGLVWERPALGGVRIGGVTGIDARGRKVRGELRPHAGGIDLVLPAAFVDGAVFPLILDPLVGSSFFLSPQDDSQPDVAWDDTNGVYLVVFDRKYSSLDADIVGQRIDGQGNLVGSAIQIDSGSPFQTRPRVANMNVVDRFVVVWREQASPLGPFSAVGRVVGAGTGSVSPPFAVSTPGEDVRHLDIGGDRTSSGDRCIAVWSDGNAGTIEVAAFRIGISGSSIGSLRGPPLASTGAEPSISQSGGDTGTWVVCWSRTSLLTGPSVHARAISSAGGPRSLELFVGAGFQPSIDGDGTTFLVAWQTPETPPFGPVHDIHARTLRWDPSGVLANASSSRGVARNGGRDETEPTVAFAYPKFLIAWTELRSGLNTDVSGIAYGPDGLPCGIGFRLGGASPVGLRDHQPATGSQWSGGTETSSALIVFADHEGVPPFSGAVTFQRFESLAGGPTSQVFPGCGAAGTSTFGSPFAIGNSDFELVLENVNPSTRLAFLSASLVPVVPLTCGTCALLPGHVFFVQPRLGTAAVSIPIPCNMGLRGATLDFQWLEYGTPANPCALALSLSATDWKRATLDF